MKNNRPLPECLVPVPLHNDRLATRGYNQALEIARPLKKLLKIPIKFHAIKRVKATLAQTLVKTNERSGNVKNAFQLHQPLPYKYIAIVDDVTTTFSTVSELALEFRRHGVERIDVWCIARAGG